MSTPFDNVFEIIFKHKLLKQSPLELFGHDNKGQKQTTPNIKIRGGL